MRLWALLAVFACAGCIHVHTERTVRVIRPVYTSEDAVTLQEIDAAAGLAFDSSRAGALGAIAVRPSLSAAAQVHLVRATYAALGFDDSKLSVLLKVINNPGFSLAAKQEVLAHLPELSFDASRARLLEELNKRGAV